MQTRASLSPALLLTLATMPLVSLADTADMKRDARIAVLSDAEETKGEKKHRKKEKHQSNHKAGDTVTLAETKVTSSKLLEQQRLASEVPQAGIAREEFGQRNNRRLGDVLQRLPGVQMGGPPGQPQDVQLRGLDKEFTRTQVDGVRLPDGGEKREFQVNRIPSFLVDKVTVIRNQTAEYESDGLAGQVDVKTRTIPKGKPQAEARLGYGGHDDGLDGDIIHGSLGFGYRPVDWFGGSGAFDYQDNTVVRPKFKSFSTGKTEDENETERQESTNFFGDLGTFYDGGEFHFKPMVLELDKDKTKTKVVREKGKVATKEDEHEDALQSTYGLGLSHRHTFKQGSVWESRAGFYQSEEDKDKSKPAFKETKLNSGLFALDKTTLEKEDKQDKTWDVASSLRTPFTLGLPQELKFGVAFRQRERDRDKLAQEVSKAGKLTNTTKPKDKYALEETYYAAFIQDNVWLTDRISLMPGIRAEHVALLSATGDGVNASKNTTDLNPSLHFLYRVRDDLSLRAAFSKSLSRPKFDELSPFEQDDGNTKIVIGNPDLDPARSWNFDAGGEYSIADLFFAVNLFHKEVSDVIEEVDTGVNRGTKDIFQVENVGDGWTRGIELEQRLGLGWTGLDVLSGVKLWTNETLLESELTDKSGKQRPFKNQPRFLTNAGIDYNYAPWGTTFTLAWNYIPEQWEDKPDGTSKAILPSSTFDVSAYQRLYKGLSAFAEINNLTDEHRAENEYAVNGSTSSEKVETYGRTFLAGVKWQY